MLFSLSLRKEGYVYLYGYVLVRAGPVTCVHVISHGLRPVTVKALKIEEEVGLKDLETRVILEDISDIEDLDLASLGEEEQLDLIRVPKKRKRVVLSEDSSDERSDDGELPSIRVSRRARATRQT